MPLGGAAGRQLTWWFLRVAPDEPSPDADSDHADNDHGGGELVSRHPDEQAKGEDDAKPTGDAPGG
jgi:hypothetical protein